MHSMWNKSSSFSQRKKLYLDIHVCESKITLSKGHIEFNTLGKILQNIVVDSIHQVLSLTKMGQKRDKKTFSSFLLGGYFD